MCVCPVRALTFESLDLETIFGMQVHLQNTQVKFVCQGHRVKVKVTGAKNWIYERVFSYAIKSRFCSCDLDLELFRLNARVHGTFFVYYCVIILCPVYVHYCLKPKNLKTFFCKNLLFIALNVAKLFKTSVQSI